MKPQCQKQVGNTGAFPGRIVLCPHNAEPDSRWCAEHQWMDEIADRVGRVRRAAQ